MGTAVGKQDGGDREPSAAAGGLGLGRSGTELGGTGRHRRLDPPDRVAGPAGRSSGLAGSWGTAGVGQHHAQHRCAEPAQHVARPPGLVHGGRWRTRPPPAPRRPRGRGPRRGGRPAPPGVSMMTTSASSGPRRRAPGPGSPAARCRSRRVAARDARRSAGWRPGAALAMSAGPNDGPVEAGPGDESGPDVIGADHDDPSGRPRRRWRRGWPPPRSGDLVGRPTPRARPAGCPPPGPRTA